MAENAEIAVSQNWHRGDWMQTFTGRQFYPLSPRPEDIDPADIAHALSLICRYGGHVERFYSVAEHCVLLSYAVAPEYALWALLHDATEAYVGDMVRPLKRNMPDYVAAEDYLMGVIATRFHLTRYARPGGMPDEVKDADTRILLNERAVLLKPTPHPWAQDDLDPLPHVVVSGWSPDLAEREYRERMNELLTYRIPPASTKEADRG